MKARLLSIALAICMALSLTPVAYATEGDATGGESGGASGVAEAVATYNGTGYETLSAAVEAVISSDTKSGTVVLNRDAEGPGIGLFNANGASEVNLTIDFDGNTYTCADPAVGSTGTETQGFHLEKGNTVVLKNGAVKVSESSQNTKMLIQNYCDLTLENIKLTGAGITQYIVSCNYGDMKLRNVDISGSYNNVVAIDLMHWLNAAYHDKAPTMSIENDADNIISGGIDVYCYGNYNGVNANSCTEKPSLTITGGSYAEDVSAFVPDGYSCKQNAETGIWTVAELEAGSMELESAPVENGTVSATLDGIFDSNGTEIADDNAGSETGASNGNVTVDLSSAEDSEEATGATLIMPANTAKSLASATSLTLKSDVGDVTLNDVALRKIGAEGLSNPVTVSIEKASVGDEEVKAAYTVEVKANNQNLLPPGAYDNGSVIVSVPKPAGVENPQAWYVVQKDNSLVYVNKLPMTDLVGGILSIEIGHLSTIVLTDGTPDNQAVANVTGSSQEITPYTSLDEALGAVAESGGTIELLKEATMTKGVTFKNDVTIIGNNKTITGKEDDASVCFKVESGTFTISDVTLKDFGSNAGTNSGIAVIKVESGKTNTKVVATDVNVINFCRSAYDIRSGEFEITDGTIDCGGADTGTNSRLTKGILAGLGTGQVSGTVNNVTITNSSSNYEDWNTAGIEIYKNAHVIINDSTITDVENGIHVDNYWSSESSSDTGAVVKVEDSTVEAANDAIRVYGNGPEGANDTTASITVVGGKFKGDIAVINGTENDDFSAQKETVSVTGATIDGTIDNENGVMGFVDSTITNAGVDAASALGVTYVNTTVDGTLKNTPTSGKEALLNGVQYETLEAAIAAATNGDVITLLDDVTLDGTNKQNTEGLLTITKDITLNGNGKTIRAKNVTVTGESSGPSMINIQDSANVIVQNLIIDGEGGGEGSAGNTKHGLNVYGDETNVTVADVTIKNGNGYGIVVNGAQATINGLMTSDNGWGGVNVDSKSGKASLVIENAKISEENSVKIENGATDDTADPSVEIAAGTFKYITTGDEIDMPNLFISGGTFATGSAEGAVSIGDYVVEGMEWNSSTGQVVEITPVTPSGPGGGGVTTPSYDVTIAQPEGGTVSVDPTDAEAGEEVTVTVKPDEGLTLGDLIVTDEDGNTVKVAANEDGTYSFEMPEGDVTITATFVCDGGALCPTDKFTDIDQAQWYHFAIDWVVENGVMKGIGGTTLFAPDDDLLREQAATVMWNIMAEGDLEAPAAALSDVAQGEWYAPYVNWAVEAAVMEGHGGTDRFGVGEALTREQFAAVVAKATKADVSAADATALEGFTDSENVSEWAQATMAWAVEAGVINGVALSDGTLELQGSREITRAEMAMMIKNAVDEGVLEL